MNYQNIHKKIIVKDKEIILPFAAKNILDFGSLLVIYLAPIDEKEYKNYVELVENKKLINLFAINEEGKVIWKYSNRYIAGIKKVPHKSPLIMLNTGSKNEKETHFDILVDCQGWNFYLNPETGEKIWDEQTK